MIIKIEGFVYELDYGFGKKQYALYSSDRMGDRCASLVGPASFEYELPESFSSVGAQIARLQAEREEAGKKFSETVSRIDDELRKLTAIEHQPEAA